MRFALAAVLSSIAALSVGAFQNSPPAILFELLPIEFTLDSGETPERHAPETMAGGVGVFDYDNDGDLDVFFSNGADIKTLKKNSSTQSNRLFANNGKGGFTDVTERSGLAGSGFDNGVALGDFDNDGYTDLFVGGVHRNTLYRNNGNGTFADVTERAGLNKPDPEFGPLWSVGGAWADVNNDGKLDLFVVNYINWSIDTEPPCDYKGRREYCHPKFYKKLPNQLFLNKGEGLFEDISAASGIRKHLGKGMGVATADYDRDGLVDLFVANDKLNNSLFHNKGNGKFDEVAFENGVALVESGEFISGMGVDFRDFDNDGYSDIFVVALDDETFPLFRNTGKNSFVDSTAASSIGRLSLPMAGYSPNMVDFDNDGWKDIFVSRGHVQSLLAAPRITVEQHNTVFRNLGNGKFAALTEEAGLGKQTPSRHRGSAVGDLNADGRLDVVVSSIGKPAEIWINRSPDERHWIGFSLSGSKSNRGGVGAQIKVVTKLATQYDHVSSASGYASSSAGPVHFGLGLSTSAELVEVRWPSGVTQVLENVEGDRVLRLDEPAK